MKLTYLNLWLADREINAICWTLIHSLWIGLIVAILAGVIVVCTGKSKANLRYRLFCSLLVLFIITISGVGMYELTGTDVVPIKNSSLISTSDQALSENQSVKFSHALFLDNGLALLNQNVGWLFGVWLIFFVFKSAKLVIGLFYIQRIRSYKIQPVSEEWALKIQEFSDRMGIRKRVGVIQSTLVKVPVALGYFKPLIVLPVGLLFQLPVAQVETIIWHELAHIYRRDYLINILQKMIETIFFFNPAVLWISELIREEREACCDDIVLANVQQKTNYLAALVAFHGQNSTAGLVMGLSLRPNQLMNRLRRMVHQENKRLSLVELVVLAVGLLMLSAFTFIPQVKPGIKNGVVYIKKAFSETLSTTAPRQSQAPKLVAQSPTSSNTALPNKEEDIRTDTLIKFKSVRFKNSNEDKANREINVIDGQDNRYHIIVANGKLNLVEFNEQAVAANEFDKFENLLAQIDHLIQQKLINPSPQYVKDDNNMAKKMTLGSKKATFPPNKQSFSDSLKVSKEEKANAKFLYLSNDKDIAVKVPKKKIPRVDASADKVRILGVISSLVEHKVVPNGPSVDWFALTEDQLVVNGQKQDRQLHQQLKTKYGIRPDYGLFFGPSKVHGIGIFFDKEDL
jgi:bla regulator protein blaR1